MPACIQCGIIDVGDDYLSKNDVTRRVVRRIGLQRRQLAFKAYGCLFDPQGLDALGGGAGDIAALELVNAMFIVKGGRVHPFRHRKRDEVDHKLASILDVSHRVFNAAVAL